MSESHSSAPSSGPDTQWVQVGTVVGTHGKDGRLRIETATDNPRRFRKGARLVIGRHPYTVQRAAAAPGRQLLLDLAELRSREEAQSLVQQAIEVPEGDIPTLPPGSYYHYQLLDMTVKDTSGTVLGRLTEVLTTGANDVYVVTGASSELMVPALADVVLNVDVDASEMTVALPEGIEPRPLAQAKRRAGPRPRSRKPPRPAA